MKVIILVLVQEKIRARQMALHVKYVLKTPILHQIKNSYYYLIKVSSIEEFCPTLVDVSVVEFSEALTFAGVDIEQQAQSLVDCLIEAGLLQG